MSAPLPSDGITAAVRCLYFHASSSSGLLNVWLAVPLRVPQSRSWVARAFFSQRLSPVGGLGRSVARVGGPGPFVVRVGVPAGAMPTAPRERRGTRAPRIGLSNSRAES